MKARAPYSHAIAVRLWLDGMPSAFVILNLRQARNSTPLHVPRTGWSWEYDKGCLVTA